jgi:hypothetical protein
LRAESRSKIAPDRLQAVFEIGDFGEGVVFHVVSRLID